LCAEESFSGKALCAWCDFLLFCVMEEQFILYACPFCGKRIERLLKFSIFSLPLSPPCRRTPVLQVQDKPGFESHCDTEVSWCVPYCQIKWYPIFLFTYVILCPPFVYLMTSFYLAEFSHYYQIKSVAFQAR
jgi:hypothetical protein